MTRRNGRHAEQVVVIRLSSELELVRLEHRPRLGPLALQDQGLGAREIRLRANGIRSFFAGLGLGENNWRRSEHELCRHGKQNDSFDSEHLPLEPRMNLAAMIARYPTDQKKERRAEARLRSLRRRPFAWPRAVCLLYFD